MKTLAPAVALLLCTLAAFTMSDAAVEGLISGNLVRVRGAAANYFESVEFFFPDGRQINEDPGLAELWYQSDSKITIDCGPGDCNEGLILLLGGLKTRVRLEYRYQTAMGLSGDGRSMDLRKWKRYQSQWELVKQLGSSLVGNVKWQEMNRLGRGEFYFLLIPESDKFPKVSRAEIVRAVRDEMRSWVRSGKSQYDEGYIDLARQCKSPRDEPCTVFVSKTEIRIRVQEGGWKDLLLIEISDGFGD